MNPLGVYRAPEGCGGRLRVVEGRPRNPTHGRQGKRPDRGPAHVVGKIEEFANAANTPCWRFHQIVQGFQASERRRYRSPRSMPL